MLSPDTFDLGTFPVEKTIQIVAEYLDKLTRFNDSLRPPSRTQFHAQSVPAIEVNGYLTRIQKYCPATNECYLAIIVYVHHVMRLNRTTLAASPITVDSYSIHRLIIASIVLAAKLFSDVFFTNHRYAKVGGIKIDELNRLEVLLLVSLDYQLFIPQPTLQCYGDHLLRRSLPFTPPSPGDLPILSPSHSPFPPSCEEVDTSLTKLSLTHYQPTPVDLPGVGDPV